MKLPSETPGDPDRLCVYLAFSESAVKGPYWDEQTAVDAIAQDNDEFHVEPRYVCSSATQDSVARDVHPTY